jgi:hypothetical protein
MPFRVIKIRGFIITRRLITSRKITKFISTMEVKRCSLFLIGNFHRGHSDVLFKK